MDEITTQMRKVQLELRLQNLTESKICEVIPDFYEEKCGKFLYPLIPFDPPQWKLHPVPPTACKKPKSKLTPRGEEPWTYKKFEKKLSNGVLTIPSLNLEHVPKSIFGFSPPLRIVYLNDNALTTLPHNFFDDLPLLAWLDVRNNKLRQLPELTRTHEALRTLLMEGNSIIRLPVTLYLAETLTTIQLRGNPIIDPPGKIVQMGTASILSYLSKRFQHPEIREDGTMSESDLDEAITLLHPVQKGKKFDLGQKGSSNLRFMSGDSRETLSGVDKETMPKSKALKTIYSDALWRYVNHEGPGPFQLLAKAQDEMRTNVQRKLAAQKDAILQRIKDREARANFRTTSLQLQLKGLAKRKAESYSGPKPPFGISPATGRKQLGHQPKALGLEDFHQEFLQNWERLNTLTSNPVALDDVEKVKDRLKEFEEIQHKISNMKLSMKISI